MEDLNELRKYFEELVKDFESAQVAVVFRINGKRYGYIIATTENSPPIELIVRKVGDELGVVVLPPFYHTILYDAKETGKEALSALLRLIASYVDAMLTFSKTLSIEDITSEQIDLQSFYG